MEPSRQPTLHSLLAAGTVGEALSLTNPSLSSCLRRGGGVIMPLVVVLRTAQAPKRLMRLTPLGICLGSLHGKDEGYVDEVLVDRTGGLSHMWRKGDPAWWIRVAEDRESCCCFGGVGFGAREDMVAEARASCCCFEADGFGVREDCLGVACTYRAVGTTGSSALKPVYQVHVMVQVQSRALASDPV
jgi:hypothetical protein